MKEIDKMFKTTKFEKYFWLPLHWYFLNYVLFNPLNWIKRIKFRIKHKCPYKDVWSLDCSFYEWVYPRAIYTIKFCLDNYVLEKQQKKDYKRMLKILDILKLFEFDVVNLPKTKEKLNDEFLELWKKYLTSLWT